MEHDGAAANESSSAGTQRRFPVTVRAVVLGIMGAIVVPALQVAWTVNPRTPILPFHSFMTLFAGAIFWLFILALLNVGLRRWKSDWMLRPAEFAVIYGLTTVGASIAGWDEAQFLLPMWVYPFRAAQAQDAVRVRPFLPEWLVPHDPNIVEPYYYGAGSFWTHERISAWIVPLINWTIWLTVLGATAWAWNVILRRRWVDHDRLSFPCVQLPLEMCRSAGFGGAVSGKLFWAGFSCSALLETLSVLHDHYPSVPSFPMEFEATPLLEGAPSPWNALAPMSLNWSTIHLGICYLIPHDILFSAWFFFIFRKGLEVFGRAMGWRDLGWDAAGFPHTRSQTTGAWAALFVLLVWAERHHLRRVLASAFSRSRYLDDSNEPGSYRAAAIVLITGTLFQILWSVVVGMSIWLSVIYTVFFWMLYVTMTRIYAQVGPPILELYYLDPQKALTTLFGTGTQSPQSLTIFSYFYWINRDHRGQPMAHELVAFKVGQVTGVRMRPFGRWIIAAFAIGGLTCLLTYLHFAYKVGEDQFQTGGWRASGAGTAINRVNDWVTNAKGPNWQEIAYMAVGAAVTLALAKASYMIVGFPFHPIGYALAMCFAVEYNWPAFLMMWVIKGLVLRYGGRGLYMRFIPFALGVTLSGLVVPVLWGFVAWLFRWYQ